MKTSLLPGLTAFALGEPIQPLGFRRDGRPIFPIAGGAPDDPPKDDPPKQDPPKDDPPKQDPPKDDPPKNDPEGPKPGQLGYFPPDTPRADMKPEEQLAYDAFHGRKHENRAKEWHSTFGGKSAAEVHAELEALRREKLSDQEKAVEDAKTAGRQEAATEYGPKAVKTALKLLLGDMPDAEKEAEIELLDLSKFITESGDVDTDKVRRAADKIAPPAGTAGQRRIRDFGAGDRRTDKSSGVKAGRDLYAERRKTTSSTTDS